MRLRAIVFNRFAAPTAGEDYRLRLKEVGEGGTCQWSARMSTRCGCATVFECLWFRCNVAQQQLLCLFADYGTVRRLREVCLDAVPSLWQG